MQGATKCAIKGAHFVADDKLCRGDKMCCNSTPKTPASGQQDIRVVMKRKEPSSSLDHEDSAQGKVLKSDDSIS